MKSNAALFALVVSFAFSASASADTLYSQYSGKNVKVYIADIEDKSSSKEVTPEALKAQLEAALNGRKSINFNVVGSREEADIAIVTTINDFMWTDHDPVDMIVGIGGTAADIAVVEDYAKLEADIAVVDAKSDRSLWKDRIIATVTKKPMSRAESIPLIAEDFSKVFVKEAFAKKR